ncbi:hypothetical protein PENSPDRAFT_752651 [Peniophora sp. CONT]|nr:hypothetical protein PENSPDRAFT_752651 [Peniophora sp. CONT]
MSVEKARPLQIVSCHLQQTHTMSTSSPIYTLPPARIPVPATFESSSEPSSSPRPSPRDASDAHTQTPSSELRAYTPRAALYTPDAPQMPTMRLQSLTPPSALVAFLSTPSPARRLGVFTPARYEGNQRGGSEEGEREGRATGELHGGSDTQEVFGGADIDTEEMIGEVSDNESVASGRLGTIAEGLSDREDEEMRLGVDVAAPAVSPQANHPTLQRGQSQAPGDMARGSAMGDDDGSDASSVRSRLGTVAEGLSDEERDVEDYLMQEEDLHDLASSS